MAEEVALPKIRISLVGSDFQLSDSLGFIRSYTIDPIDATAETNGRFNTTATLTGEFSAMTTQVLLRIEDNKDFSLALSEVNFCMLGE